VETRVEQKITIQSDGDPIDHDRALAEAIQVQILHDISLTKEFSIKHLLPHKIIFKIIP
jgi:4.1 protein C-terminal domain (CTD)